MKQEFLTVRICKLLQERGPMHVTDITKALGLNFERVRASVYDLRDAKCIAAPNVRTKPILYTFVAMPRPSVRGSSAGRGGGLYGGIRKRAKAQGSGVTPQHRYMPEEFRALRRPDISERAALCMMAR